MFNLNFGMKAIFITCNQAYYEEIVEIMDSRLIRGYTYWDQVRGRGSKSGDPRLGSHAWPEMNSAIMTVVEDSSVDAFLDDLHRLDSKREALGLRAFVLPVERAI